MVFQLVAFQEGIKHCLSPIPQSREPLRRILESRGQRAGCWHRSRVQMIKNMPISAALRLAVDE
jgi:hypothetical protein